MDYTIIIFNMEKKIFCSIYIIILFDVKKNYYYKGRNSGFKTTD
jgi:hypothetical protein